MNAEAAARAILKPIDETVAAECRTLLRHLMSRNAANYFNQPVDWLALKIPNYPITIKQPMDLGTVLDNLIRDAPLKYEEKRYQWLEELAHDVRLVSCVLRH